MSTYDDSEQYVPSLDVLIERQRGLARSVGDLLKWRNGRDGIDAWRAVTDQRVDAVVKELQAVKRLLWGLIFTCLGGFMTVALAVFLSAHGVHTP